MQTEKERSDLQFGINIRRLDPNDLSQLTDLQNRYALRYPGSTVLQGNTYRLPRFSKVEDFFGVFDETRNLIGYVALHPMLVFDGPANLSHVLWADLKVDPGCENLQAMFDVMLDYLIKTARNLVNRFPPRSTQMVFQKFPIEVEIIQHLHQRGFVHTESIFQMSRRLNAPIQPMLAPPGMQSVPWRMHTVEEQRKYLQGRNQAFPEAAITLEDWRCFMRSALWETGICLAILDGDELAGSILLYWDEEQNRLNDKLVGFTEYIFVLPRWRGLGLGSFLVTQGLLYLKKHGLAEAQLEVKAADIGALGLYSRLGYQVIRESWFMENTL